MADALVAMNRVAYPVSLNPYLVNKGRSVPDVNPLNPKYKLMVEAWRRLPLPVANRLGPWLARHLA